MAAFVSFVTLAEVVDLSYDGIGLETSVALPLGARFKVHVEGPELALTGRTVWMTDGDFRGDERGERRTVYRSGLCFDTDPGQGRRQRIARYLYANALDTNSDPTRARQPRPPRYRLRGSTPRVVHTQLDLDIQLIGMGGLVGATTRALEPGTPVSIRLDAPSGPLLLLAHASEVHPPGERPTARVVFEFEELGKENLDRLAQFLNEQAIL